MGYLLPDLSIVHIIARENFISYFIDTRLNFNGSIFFVQKTKKMILKKINSMKGLVSVWGFFTSRDPLMLSLIV